MNDRPEDDARRLVLDRLDELYRESMAAWAASKAPATRTRTSRYSADSTAVRVTETRPSTPDCRYLQEARKALEGTRVMLGLDAPARAAHAHLVAIQARVGDQPGVGGNVRPRPAVEASDGGTKVFEENVD